MAYKYLNASPTFGQTPKETYVDLFQETLNQQFENATDFWTILEEETVGSGTYQNVDVRIITHVISSMTGKLLGDDYKQILFPDLTHAVGSGYMYQFDSNYWITINSEKTKNLAASSTVKRCNNTLRWIDVDGAVHTEPCSIDYEISRNKDMASTSAFIVEPEGLIEVICQFNDRTNLIRPNQRFLFGNADNWTAYKTMGGGINNYNNLETLNGNSVGFIRLKMEVNYLSDNDDLTNGIAYEDKNVYTLTLSETTIVGIPTNTRQLYTTITLNGSTVTRTVEWSSSDITRVTVNTSGLVTLVKNTITTPIPIPVIITCHLEGDASVNDTVAVTISSTPSDYYQVIISPDTDYILEGEIQIYTVSLYKNGTDNHNTFTFNLDANTVPSTCYGYSATANSFSVENKIKCLIDYLEVTCTSITDVYIKVQKIYLKGSW